MRPTIRTVRISPRALMRLLQRITAGTPLHAVMDGVPQGTALGAVRFLHDEQILELDLVHHDWPEGRTGPIDFCYVEELGAAGTSGHLYLGTTR